MLNEFESCCSRLFRSKSTHSPCSACCRKRVGWIRCKCNQNLERNESARRVSFVGKRYWIARSFAKDDDAYGLHGSSVGVCSNERECVAFCIIEKFYARVDPSRGDSVHNFFNFFMQTFPCVCRVCVPSVRADFGCDRTKDVAPKREHTDRQTDRQTDNLSFI